MIILIICVIVLGRIGEEIDWCGGGILGGFIGIILGIFLACFIGEKLPVNEIIDQQEIVALKDSSETDGQYFLFSGYVDEKLVYRYVIETDKGKYITESKASDTYLKEVDNSKHYIESHKFKFKHDWYYWFTFNIKSADNYNVIYVPNGTVTTEYNVDLQ